MATLQVECTCNDCNMKWFYLPFEEARMVMADILRIQTRDLNWRERRRYFGSPSRGCGCLPGCGSPGCTFLEGIACGELLGGCGSNACCLPGCGITSFTLLLPFANFVHPFIQMMQINRTQTLHRACPGCGSGWFERVLAKYEDEGRVRTVESRSWQLPVVDAIHVEPIFL